MSEDSLQCHFFFCANNAQWTIKSTDSVKEVWLLFRLSNFSKLLFILRCEFHSSRLFFFFPLICSPLLSQTSLSSSFALYLICSHRWHAWWTPVSLIAPEYICSWSTCSQWTITHLVSVTFYHLGTSLSVYVWFCPWSLSIGLRGLQFPFVDPFLRYRQIGS